MFPINYLDCVGPPTFILFRTNFVMNRYFFSWPDGSFWAHLLESSMQWAAVVRLGKWKSAFRTPRQDFATSRTLDQMLGSPFTLCGNWLNRAIPYAAINRGGKSSVCELRRCRQPTQPVSKRGPPLDTMRCECKFFWYLHNHFFKKTCIKKCHLSKSTKVLKYQK